MNTVNSSIHGLNEFNFDELHYMIGAKEYHGKRIVGHLT